MGDYSNCEVSAAKNRRFCLTGLKAESTDYQPAHLDVLLPPPSPFKTVSKGETPSVRSNSNSSSPVRSPMATGTCPASRFGFHRPVAVADRRPAGTTRTGKSADLEVLDGRYIGAAERESPVEVKADSHDICDKISVKEAVVIDGTRRVSRNGVQRSVSVDTAGHESGIGSDSDSGNRASPELLVDDRQVDFSSSSPLYSPVENSSPESRSTCRDETVSGGSRILAVDGSELSRKQQLLKMIDSNQLKPVEYCSDPLPVLAELPEVQSPQWRHIAAASMAPIRRLEREDVDRLIVPPPAPRSADTKQAATGNRIPERRIADSGTEVELNARRRLPTIPPPSDAVIDVVSQRPPPTKRPSTSLGLPVESGRVQIALTPSAGAEALGGARPSCETSTATMAERVAKDMSSKPKTSLYGTAEVPYSTSSVDRLQRRRLPVADSSDGAARLVHPNSNHLGNGEPQGSIVGAHPAGSVDQQMATFPRARGRRNVVVQRCRSDIVDEEVTCEKADVVDSGTVDAVSSPVCRVDSFGRNDPLLRMPVRGARTSGSRPASVIPHTFRSTSLQDNNNARASDDFELTGTRRNNGDAVVPRRRPASVLLQSYSATQSDEQSTSSTATSTIGSIVSRIGRRLTSVGVRTSSDQPEDADDVRRGDYLPASAPSTWDRRLTKVSAASKDSAASACPSTALAVKLSPPTPIGLDRGGSKRDSIAARTERTFGAGAAFHTFRGDITPMRWTEDESAADTWRSVDALELGIGDVIKSAGTFQFPDTEVVSRTDQSPEEQSHSADKSNQQQQQQQSESEIVQQLETRGKSKPRSNLPSPSRQHPTTQQQQHQQLITRSEITKPLHVITDDPCCAAAVPPELSPSASKMPQSGTSRLRQPTSPPSESHSRAARRSSAGIPDAGLTKGQQMSPLSSGPSKLPSPTERIRRTADAAVPDQACNLHRQSSTAVDAAPSKLQQKMTGGRSGPSSPLELARSSAQTAVSTVTQRKPVKIISVSSAQRRRPDPDAANVVVVPAPKHLLPSPSATSSSSDQPKMKKIGSPTYQPRPVGGTYFQFTSQQQQQQKRKSMSPPIETQSQLPQKAPSDRRKPTSPPPAAAPSPEYRHSIAHQKEPTSPTRREMIAPSKIQRGPGPLSSPRAVIECHDLWERGAETGPREQPKKTGSQLQPSKIVPAAMTATAPVTSLADLADDPEQRRKMRLKAQQVICQQQQQQQRLRRRSDELPVAPSDECERNFVGGRGAKSGAKKRPESFQVPLRPSYNFSSNATSGIPSPGVSSPTARSPTRFFPDPASTPRSAKSPGCSAGQTTAIFFAAETSQVEGLSGVAEDPAGETMWAVDCTGPEVVLTTPTSTPQRDIAFKKLPMTAAGSTFMSKLSPRRQLFTSQMSEPASAAANNLYSRQASWPTQPGSTTTSGTLRSTTTTADSCSTLRSNRVTADQSPQRYDERPYGQSMMMTPTTDRQGTSSQVGSYHSLSKATWNDSDVITPPRPFGESLSPGSHCVKSSTPASVKPDQSSTPYAQQATSLPRRLERPKMLHSQSTVEGSIKEDESRYKRPSRTTPVVSEPRLQAGPVAVGSDDNVARGGLRPHTASGQSTAVPLVDAKPPTGNRRHTTEVQHVPAPDSNGTNTGSGEDQLDRPQSPRKTKFSKKLERMGLFSLKKKTPGGPSKDRRTSEGQSNSENINDQLDRRTLPNSTGFFQEEGTSTTVDTSRTSQSVPGTPIREGFFQFGVDATPPNVYAGKTDYGRVAGCSGNPSARTCSSLGRPRTSLGLRIGAHGPDSSLLSTPTKSNSWDFQTLLSTPSTPDGLTPFQLASLPADLLNDVEKEVTTKRYTGDKAREEAIYDVERLVAAWDLTDDRTPRGCRRRTVSNVEEIHGSLTSSTSNFDGGPRHPRELPVDCPSASTSAQSLDVEASPETDERRRAEFSRSVKKFISACRDLSISATALAHSAAFDDRLTICVHCLAVLLASCRRADFDGPPASQLESRIYDVATVFASVVDASRLSVGKPLGDAGVTEMMRRCSQLLQALAKLKNAANVFSRRPPMAYL